VTCESQPGLGTTFTIILPTRVEGRRPAARRAEIAEGAAS
jgi:hypothetical protein